MEALVNVPEGVFHSKTQRGKKQPKPRRTLHRSPDVNAPYIEYTATSSHATDDARGSVTSLWSTYRIRLTQILAEILIRQY